MGGNWTKTMLTTVADCDSSMDDFVRVPSSSGRHRRPVRVRREIPVLCVVVDDDVQVRP